jgi:hypothetical protein
MRLPPFRLRTLMIVIAGAGLVAYLLTQSDIPSLPMQVIWRSSPRWSPHDQNRFPQIDARALGAQMGQGRNEEPQYYAAMV